MRARTVISRRAWLCVICSALLYGAVSLVTHRFRPVAWAGDAELVALSGDRDRLAANTDQEVETWRHKEAGLVQIAWTADRIADWQSKLGPGWNVASDEGRGSDRRALLTRDSPRLDEFPAYLALSTALAATAGVRIESLEITATGAGRHRRLTRVAFALRFLRAGTSPRFDPAQSEPTTTPGQPAVTASPNL